MNYNALLRRTTALIACLCLMVSSTTAVWAQAVISNDAGVLKEASVAELSIAEESTTEISIGQFTDLSNLTDIQTFLAQVDTGTLGFDITAPTISHTPSISKGVAGETQTVVAEISDNQAVQRALLIYRTSSSEFFKTAEMSADVTNTTWLATIDTTTDDSLINYYIVAEDTDGNRVQKGSEGNPLTLELQQTELFGAIAPVKKGNRNTWIGIGLGLFVAVALLASGGGGDEGGGIVNSDETTTCCTVTFVVPNVTSE